MNYGGMGSGKSFLIREIKYYFYKKDEILINIPFKKPIKGFVLFYNPDKAIPHQRLLVKDIKGEKYHINPCYAKPISHDQLDNRTRIYLNHNDNKIELHLLMNQHIVCLPTHRIGDKKEYSNTFNSSCFFIIDEILVGNEMFFYIGYDRENNNYVVQKEQYDSNGEIKHRDLISLSSKANMVTMINLLTKELEGDR